MEIRINIDEEMVKRFHDLGNLSWQVISEDEKKEYERLKWMIAHNVANALYAD
jgi:hypothetical protein